MPATFPCGNGTITHGMHGDKDVHRAQIGERWVDFYLSSSGTWWCFPPGIPWAGAKPEGAGPPTKLKDVTNLHEAETYALRLLRWERVNATLSAYEIALSCIRSHVNPKGNSP